MVDCAVSCYSEKWKFDIVSATISWILESERGKYNRRMRTWLLERNPTSPVILRAKGWVFTRYRLVLSLSEEHRAW